MVKFFYNNNSGGWITSIKVQASWKYNNLKAFYIYVNPNISLGQRTFQVLTINNNFFADQILKKGCTGQYVSLILSRNVKI